MSVSQLERVAGILRNASYSNDTKGKLEYLRQVRELIINYDRSLLDSFFEVLFCSLINGVSRRLLHFSIILITI